MTDGVKKLKKSFDSADGAMRTTIVSNFFLAAFLKLSMKHIIKLINAL